MKHSKGNSPENGSALRDGKKWGFYHSIVPMKAQMDEVSKRFKRWGPGGGPARLTGTSMATGGESTDTPSKPSMTAEPDVLTIHGVSCGISVLTCSNSTGNPAPSYRWYDTAENVILTATNILTLAEVNRTYRCEAYNTIGTVEYSESVTYTVSNVNCASTAQCCAFPRKETTSVTVEGCDNGTVCDCSQGNSGIILTCNAKTFPNASYTWTSPNGQVTNSPIYDEVKMNGTYRCTAYFNRISSNYTGDVTFPNESSEATVGLCSQNPALETSTISPAISTMANADGTTVCRPTSGTNNEVAVDVAIAMGVLFGISLLANIILLVILMRKQDPSKRKENNPEPQIPHNSDPFTPAAYEELRRTDGIHLQPTTYEQLTHRPPLYVNHVS